MSRLPFLPALLFFAASFLLAPPKESRAQFSLPPSSAAQPTQGSQGSAYEESGLEPVPGGPQTNFIGGIGSSVVAMLIRNQQIPKLVSMVKRLREVRERLNKVRDNMIKVREFAERDYLEMSPRNAMLTVLFGDAAWYEDLEDGLEELQGISYTLNDIRDITQDVYPGDLPYNAPMEEALDQTTRKLSTARNSIVAMRRHYEQMEADKEVLENLALDNRDAEGRRQLMQAQTRVQLHQTKNARLLRQQVATLTNLIATSETEKTNRRMQDHATRRREIEQVASQPWTEQRALPQIEE